MNYPSLFSPLKVGPYQLQHRLALAPLTRMAEEHECAVLVVVHLNKQRGGDPLYRIGGSIGQVGAARSVLSFGRDPDDPDGEPGRMQDEFRAYGRTGEPCVRCETPIRRIVLAGRATHFCPRCQDRNA